MKRDNWPVGEEGIRPAGKPDRCFYCDAEKGTVHESECVIRSRTVVVRTTVEHVISVPEHWDEGLIEDFSMGCSDNIIENDLTGLVERRKQAGRCTCGMVSREFVREANRQDEETSLLRVAELPS